MILIWSCYQYCAQHKHHVACYKSNLIQGVGIQMQRVKNLFSISCSVHLYCNCLYLILKGGVSACQSVFQIHISAHDGKQIKIIERAKVNSIKNQVYTHVGNELRYLFYRKGQCFNGFYKNNNYSNIFVQLCSPRERPSFVWS